MIRNLQKFNNLGQKQVISLKVLEWVILFIIGFAYWFPSPTRDHWVGLILLWLIILVLRFWHSKRLWTNTPFDEAFVLFLGLSLISIFTAPYETRGIVLLYRPLFGFALVLSCVEQARHDKNIRSLLNYSIIFSFCISVITITSTNWSGKSDFLFQITSALPRWDTFLWEGGFNPNEIAGVISPLIPFNLWLFLKYRRWVALIPTIILFMGLLLGQSLSGIMGMLAGLTVVLSLQRFWKYTAVLIVLLIALIQVSITTIPENTANFLASISGRDNITSMAHRAELWRSAVDILHDYPLTGVGIAMYRHPAVRADFPTPNFSSFQAVHPHNALFQTTSDLGVPGLIVILLWYGIAGYLIYRIDRSTSQNEPSLAPAFAGVLVAHLAYGLTDAIPIWDRFAFVFFWFLGLIAAQYYLSHNRLTTIEDSSR